MSSPADRFLDAATAPLADNPGLQAAAREELRSVVLADETALEKAVERLEAAPGEKTRKRRRIFFYGILVLLSLLVIGHLGWQAREASVGLQMILNPMEPPTRQGDPNFARHLSPDQRLILLGDPEATDEIARLKPLVDRHPGDPAYYAEYAAAWLNQSSELPPGFDETIARIDPGNGWFLCLKAQAIGKEAISRGGGLTGKGATRKRTPTSIRDASRLETALGLIHKASLAPQFNSYRHELFQRREALLQAPKDQRDVLVQGTIAARVYWVDFHVPRLLNLLAAQADACAATRSSEGLAAAAADWEWLAHQLAKADSPGVADSIITRSLIGSSSYAFRDAAASFPLPEMTARFQGVVDRYEEHLKQREQRQLAVPPFHGPWMFSQFGGILYSQSAAIPIPGESLLRAGRMSEHASFARFASFATGLVLLLAAGVATLYRYRHNLLVRRLSKSLERLLRLRDFLWIAVLGLALPILAFELLRQSPLGSLGLSLEDTEAKLPASQWLILTLILLMVPLLVARWRVKRSTGSTLALSMKASPLGWICVAYLAGMLATVGKWLPAVQTDLELRLLVIALPAFWWLATILRALFLGSSEQALSRLLVARAVIPVYVLGLLLCAAASALHYLEERHWVQRDSMIQADGRTFWFSSYEREAIPAVREQTLQTLGDP